MKKCILYDDRVCNDCGECMICDLDPEKLCDNCGKCLALDNDNEFISMLVHADDYEGEEMEAISGDLEDDHSNLSDEEKQLLAFLDAPIDLQIPDPLEIDRELYEKWERILASEHSGSSGKNGPVRIERPPANYAIRHRRRGK